jgi:hypothetical protein
MKPIRSIQNRARRKTVRGFTLAEMAITVGVFLFIFTGVMVGVQIFGFRIYALAATKLVATAGGRETLNQIREQIREAKTVHVGNCSNVLFSAFSLIGTNSWQQGNALIIYPTTNTASCQIYYLDTQTTTNRLIQFNATNTLAATGGTNWLSNYTNVLARFITNQIVFDARDWLNNIVTNEEILDNRLLIEVTMQFSQWEYPIAFVGGKGLNAYDYYQLRTRVFRRTWN